MTYPQLNLADAKGPKATIKTNHGDPFSCSQIRRPRRLRTSLRWPSRATMMG